MHGEYAVHDQRDRRNFTGADILRCVEALDKRLSHGGDRKSEDFNTPNGALKTSEHTADIIGTSQRTVERARTIIDHADTLIYFTLNIEPKFSSFIIHL